jgi:LacI family transcriptional regulator
MSTDASATRNAAVDAALQFIRHHWAEPIAVADIARAARMARRTLERRFMSVVGHSMHSEMERHRIAHAKHLLAATGLPAKEVGKSAGFPRPDDFSRFFKQRTGLTPLAFRARQHPSGN